MRPVALVDLDDVVERRVLFAHQSVGRNILDGVRDVLRDHGRVWPIVEIGAAPLPTGGALMHAPVGANERPFTKCDDFRRLVDDRGAGPLDVAVLKFCYADVQAHTDVVALCDRYRATLADLAQRYPATVFVPVTVPLGHAGSGLGARVRAALGRPDPARAKNVTRQAFNDWLRQGWTISPIFDLAASESTRTDGSRETFTYRGTTAENLVAAYTDDGGHLNVEGRRAVAADFLRTLAAALRARR